MTTMQVYDCGCVPSRPKDPTCKNYGTRWRAYISLKKDSTPMKLFLKCRDCNRLRHFQLTDNNPVLIQYMGREEEEDNGQEEI